MLASIKLYITLFCEFFKIGVFSFGGGYATLPFLLDISQRYNWYSAHDLTQMIAVASITPGPVGINVATYAGLKTGGMLTAVLATFAEVLPAIFIVIFISKLLKKYRDNYYVKSVLEVLKPTGCALLTIVALNLIKENLITQSQNQSSSIILFLTLLVVSLTKKKDVIWYILTSGLVGVVFVKLGLIL